MIEKSKERIEQEFQKKLRSILIMESPGTLLLGLGLYGKFGANGNAFHPLLDNPDVVNGMLVVGGLIALWGSIELVKAGQKKKEQIESERI